MSLHRIVQAVATFAVLAAPAQAEPPRVLASIAPVHSLAAMVMVGVGEPDLLVPAAASDHDYALRPSDVRKIAAADLVVWIGEPLESYLVKPLATENARNLELIEVEAVDPRPYREAGVSGAGVETYDHAHEGEDHGTEGHDHSGLDPHVWLDPVRATAIVSAIAEALTALDPDNSEAYRTNAAAAAAEPRSLDEEIGAQLAPHAAKPFVTFHDGYSYFVERYRLNQVGRLTVDPERRPGAATVAALQEKVAAEGVACAFAEPQFDPGVIETLAGEARIKVGTLDAIGADTEPGPALYAALIRKNAKAIEGCLASASPA
jgi:zinc transport system substrate-binding protein